MPVQNLYFFLPIRLSLILTKKWNFFKYICCYHNLMFYVKYGIVYLIPFWEVPTRHDQYSKEVSFKMARYDHLGYSPEDAFIRRRMQELPAPALALRTLKILGARTASMIYDSGMVAPYDGGYIVRALLEATDTFGIEVATCIAVLDPDPDLDRILLVRDYVNPFKMPTEGFKFQDDRYTIVIVKRGYGLDIMACKRCLR